MNDEIISVIDVARNIGKLQKSYVLKILVLNFLIQRRYLLLCSLQNRYSTRLAVILFTTILIAYYETLFTL